MRFKLTEKSIIWVFLSLLFLLSYSILTPIVLALSSETPDEHEHEKEAIDNSAFLSDLDTIIEPESSGEKELTNDEPNMKNLRNRERPADVVDAYLSEILANTDPLQELEVIIQFVNEIGEPDREFVTALGIELIHEYEYLPAVLAKAKKSAIITLAESPRIFWVEFNEPLEFHMEQSLMTINATKAWNTIVKDNDGNERASIDGTGVTVVVLDTGIDAGHPDLDYREKTVMNLKSDFGIAPWIEMENSDTSYGHGTHCAGTVAGNGDASAGARRGVAPGAKLIGLSIGDFGVNLANAVGGYEWVYANTHPYAEESTDYNIRVVSNSWGPSASKFDPTDVISQFIEKCTVDNNVVSVFAAGNSGENDHDGHKVETNPYGSTPMAISVAAIERDGSGLAYFSSRGEAGLNETWPDLGAPGVGIWSAAARRTYISIMKNIQDWADLDPYYFAISGTSMATPHVAGAVALLFQACPSLKLSAQHDDYSDQDDESYSGLGESWWDSSTTLVHEAELILEASANWIEPGEDNGVPDNYTIGWTGTKSDYAQGYGLINVEHAVAIALTLNELRTRDFNDDGKPDYPNATVYEAIKQYRQIIVQKNTTSPNNKLISLWDGDWTRFTEQSTSPNVVATDQSHYVFIPEGATELVVNLQYDPIHTSDEVFTVAGIQVTIDYNDDGTPDWTGSMFPRDQPDTIDLKTGGFSSNLDKLWRFNIEGSGFGAPNAPPGNFLGESYYEITVHYIVALEMIFEAPLDTIINENFSSFDINDPKIETLEFAGTSSVASDQGLNLYISYYNLRNVQPVEKPTRKDEEKKIVTPWYVWLILALALAVLAAMFYDKYRKSKKEEIE